MPAININLFRVSSDSQYLDMMFDCPRTYEFTSLILDVYPIDKEKETFDLSTAVFSSTPTRKHWTVRLPLNTIGYGPDKPAMYVATFKAKTTQNPPVDPLTPEEITDIAVCSDVNRVYYSLVDGIVDINNKCEDIPDGVIRNYLILHAHHLAMAKGELDDAMLYFKMISNFFKKCGPFKRHPHHHINSCNCVRP